MYKIIYIILAIAILIFIIIRTVKYEDKECQEENIVEPPINNIIPKPILQEKKEVYNISENIYTYYDAPLVCKVFGGRLANLNEIKEEYKKGAEWCNYGWSQGQNAYYPTQQKTWDKLQKNEEYKDMCGKPGINGGYFANPDLKFGVNCYGVKPKKTSNNSFNNETLKTPEEIEAEKKIKELEMNKHSIQILPFNEKEWTSQTFINNKC